MANHSYILLAENAQDKTMQELFQKMLQDLGPTSCTNHHKACIAWPGYEVATLEKIDIDLLAIAGAQDQAVMSAKTQLIADSVPNAQFILIQDAAHFSMLEQPEVVNKLIASFLEA
jgi:pimeloyl-ACP methyl ester carboxylesterase